VEHSLGAISSGLFYLSCSLIIIISAFKRLKFSYLLIFFEYFYILGFGIFPVLVGFGIVGLPNSALSYETVNGSILPLTYFHVISYSMGMLVGWGSFRNLANQIGVRVAGVGSRNVINNSVCFYSISIFSVIVGLIYFSLTGFQSAITNASAIRGGDFSSFSGYEQYQFLKTVSQIGLIGIIFVPYFIINKSNSATRVFLILTLIAGINYLLTAARVVFFDTVGFFMILILIYKRFNLGTAFLGTGILIILLAAVFFGKVAGAVIGLYLGGQELYFGTLPDNISNFFFGHFSHLIYSVDAGIRNFQSFGPLISIDILLSPLGFIPTFVLTSVGLDWLNYKIVSPDMQLCCINSEYFNTESPCSIPPYFVGVSAYIFPVIGGFIFGLIKFFFYSVIEQALLQLKSKPEFLWFPLLLVIIGNKLILFIPATISFAVFLLVILYCILAIKIFLKSLLQSRRS